MTLPDFTRIQWLIIISLSALMIATLGILTQWPPLQPLANDQTQLKVVVRYSGQKLGTCEQLDSAAIAKLPPNMRQAMICPREKSPLFMELAIDNQVRVSKTLLPSGIHSDGVLASYDLLDVGTGAAEIELRIKTLETADAFTHILAQRLVFDPGRIITLHFTDDGFSVSGTGT